MVTCQYSLKEVNEKEAIQFHLIRPPLQALVLAKNPHANPKGFISFASLTELRNVYISKLIQDERDELNLLEKKVIDSLASSTLLTKELNDEEEDAKITFGERVADKVASFGGSWRFIISFGVFLGLWIAANALLAANAYDPYPFILLNLILSCLAALQAPVIMMSQNRQEQKDRKRSQNDFQVNLKAELEIRQLHEKLDHMLINNNLRLLEIQKVQMEQMEQILSLLKKNPK